MGCLPSRRRFNDDADSESALDLDLDDTPLLHETSRSQNQLESVTMSNKYADRTIVADSRLETLLLKLEHARSLREKIHRLNSKTEFENYRLKVIGVLNAATVEMSRLTRENKHYEAEKVVKSIMRLKTALGDDFFEAAKINAFGREITDLGSYLLSGGQYFKPVMIQEDDDNIVKLYFFIVSEADTTNVLFRYYLEHVSFLDEYFALGLVTPEGGHTQVEIYGSLCPPYWKIRRDVINNATARLSRRHDSSEFDYSYDDLTDATHDSDGY